MRFQSARQSYDDVTFSYTGSEKIRLEVVIGSQVSVPEVIWYPQTAIQKWPSYRNGHKNSSYIHLVAVLAHTHLIIVTI